MAKQIIDENELIEMVDKNGISQAEAARRFGVSRQAVNNRLIDLRGRKSKAIIRDPDKVERLVDHGLNAI